MKDPSLSLEHYLRLERFVMMLPTDHLEWDIRKTTDREVMPRMRPKDF